MASIINIKSASKDESVYIESFDIVAALLKEDNIYTSSQKRVLMSNYLYGLSIGDETIGFVSAVKGGIYHDDIIALDLCLLKEYRELFIGDKILPSIVKSIEKSSDYNKEFIVLEKNRCLDFTFNGTTISDDTYILQNRKNEFNKIHPDGIKKYQRITRSRGSFIKARKKRGEK